MAMELNIHMPVKNAAFPIVLPLRAVVLHVDSALGITPLNFLKNILVI